jgi:NAD+ synthase
MAFDGDDSQIDCRQAEVLAIYRHLNQANQHKMKPIPVCLIDESLKK